MLRGAVQPYWAKGGSFLPIFSRGAQRPRRALIVTGRRGAQKEVQLLLHVGDERPLLHSRRH